MRRGEKRRYVPQIRGQRHVQKQGGAVMPLTHSQRQLASWATFQTLDPRFHFYSCWGADDRSGSAGHKSNDQHNNGILPAIQSSRATSPSRGHKRQCQDNAHARNVPMSEADRNPTRHMAYYLSANFPEKVVPGVVREHASHPSHTGTRHCGNCGLNSRRRRRGRQSDFGTDDSFL